MVTLLLGALQAILGALKQIPGETGAIAADILAIEAGLTSAIANHAAAQTVEDPAKLQPIDPV